MVKQSRACPWRHSNRLRPVKVIDHWLEGVERLPYPAGPTMGIRRFAVAHFTAGATAKSSVNFWRTPAAKGAEAHVVIDRDGTIFQVRAFNQRADHAGQSEWRCPNLGKVFNGLNSCSIGIEFANGGESTSLIQRFSKLPPVKARHKNGGPVKDWEAFPECQIAAGELVFRAIVKRYNLDDLIGHDDCAYQVIAGKKVFNRKSDPGPAFPMLRIREASGFTGLPKR